MSWPSFVGCVSNVNSFSKPLQCYSGLSHLGATQKPIWNLGSSPYIVQRTVLIMVNFIDGLLKGLPRTSHTDLKTPAFQFSFLLLTPPPVMQEQHAALFAAVYLVSAAIVNNAHPHSLRSARLGGSCLCWCQCRCCRSSGPESWPAIVTMGIGVSFFMVLTWSRMDFVLLLPSVWLVGVGFSCTEAWIHRRQNKTSWNSLLGHFSSPKELGQATFFSPTFRVLW